MENQNINPSNLESISKIDEQKIMFQAMYGTMSHKLKKKGSNYTPPKKKRKK
jgi:hypothetical protein